MQYTHLYIFYDVYVFVGVCIIYKYIYLHLNRQIDKQIDRQIDRKTHIDIQMNMDIRYYQYIYIYIYIYILILVFTIVLLCYYCAQIYYILDTCNIDDRWETPKGGVTNLSKSGDRKISSWSEKWENLEFMLNITSILVHIYKNNIYLSICLSIYLSISMYMYLQSCLSVLIKYFNRKNYFLLFSC